MKIKENIIKLIKNPKQIVFSTLFSVLITFLFAVYNLYLGIKFTDSWGISIAIYYFCLIFARGVILLIENKISQKDKISQDNFRKKTYTRLSIFMFFIDLCLIAPITLMILYPKDVKFGLIPALVVAIYTTYKITVAIINYVKIKKVNNLSYKFLRELSVVDALTSVLTLQHTMIMVNGGMTKDMMILSSYTSFFIVAGIILFSILAMKMTIKKGHYYK